MTRAVLLFAIAFSLAACKDDVAEAPLPADMTDEALGHYCQMFVADHPGPKAQIHLEGHAAPLWFSQVSDAVAYVHDPARDAGVTAVFVSDMEQAESWALPGTANWIPAQAAFFVIESDRPGGMGVPEAIPFGTRKAAEDFQQEEGGRIVIFEAVPVDYVHPDMPALAKDGMAGHDMTGSLN
ncbi:nitrous oxide reductase accessory protein NosL [Maritimibacter sp. DP1N21-5]|uniref:nitrous oxide reductase accessory protein NosL n=1 Tax=Maritimibacter sp. DP1N21-5 TaxID=2836867 RepID=UPI001C459B64|nr:nitrous oxide reductase accessory protein NosL [Maritimibacter sp. DP1N21-5]MBV7410074.1 nitrous oxide reductase accessory protein NosL [Maritimibacter sp. DP1N21-5]